MSKKLDELLKKYAWNTLQIQQLRIADQKKLDLSYFHPEYDWEQLREIRQCLEDGMDPTFILDKHINSDSMRKTRESIYKSSGLFEKHKEEAKAKRQKRIMTIVVFLLAVFIIGIIGLWKYDYIYSMITGIQLELIGDKYEIGVSKLSELHYIDMVKDYTRDAELILPEDNISNVGDYELTFIVKSKTKQLKKKMTVIVYDDIKPILVLKKDAITIKVSDSFNAIDYISQASDNVDGDMANKVTVFSNVDTNKEGKYEVSYVLTDSSDNITKKQLTVNVLKSNQSNVNESSHTQKENNQNTQSNSSTSKNPASNSSGSIKVTASNKIFYFIDYGTSEETQQAALNYGNEQLKFKKAKGFSCNPIMNDNVYVGYEIVFF